jgi:hypothetical protein
MTYLVPDALYYLLIQAEPFARRGFPAKRAYSIPFAAMQILAKVRGITDRILRT